MILEETKKKKLNIEEQIEDMISKNIKFELMDINEAKKYLKYNTYYFKLKSYAKNYNINVYTNKYYNLDFTYLVELSKLDMYIRRIILELSLDIEHFLKVRLLNDFCNNLQEDGYNIIRLFLQYHPNAENDIRLKANNYSFCSNLVEKHLSEDNEIENLSLWTIMELLSFGNFMELYELYYQTYKSFNYSPYLKSIKFIRNAAAHNSCILSSIRRPNSTKKFRKTKQLMTNLTKIPEFKSLTNIDGMMKNPVIHDFVALLFVYNDIMKMPTTKLTRNKKMREIKIDFCDENGRFKRNREYFSKNPYLLDAYQFVSNIIIYMDKKNHNPKHINYLQ